MKKVGNFIFIFFLLLMCAATAFETISQLKYADYSKICPVSIDSVQKLDEQNIKAIAPPDETLDIARYDYYLMVCTIENQSAIDGSFYPGSALCNGYRFCPVGTWRCLSMVCSGGRKHSGKFYSGSR